MSTRNDYSDDEWNAITTAPGAVALAIALGTLDGSIGASGASSAVGQAITRPAVTDVPEIVKVLVESVRSHGGRPELPGVPDGDPKEASIAIVRLAVRAVETKSPAEVEAFKAWLAAIAAKAFHAANAADLPAIARATLSRAEQRAIHRLASVLAVAEVLTASQPRDRIR